MRLVAICSIILIFSCSKNIEKEVRQFKDGNNQYFGDSILIGGLLKKIIYRDTIDFIDSISIERYSDVKGVKSLNSYLNGRKVFENLSYYSNGNIETYEFIDEDNPKYYYNRYYSKDGSKAVYRGSPFFQGYISVISNLATKDGEIEMKKGDFVRIRVFHPMPPDCNVRIYVKDFDGEILDVFKQSRMLSFLHSTSVRGDEVGTYRIEICMEISCGQEAANLYSQSFFYSVIE